MFHKLAPSNAEISITPKDTLLLVGGTPMNSPFWVSLQVIRNTTLSPSATISSIVALKSGNALRNMAVSCLTPSRPDGIPGGFFVLNDVGCQELVGLTDVSPDEDFLHHLTD
jgi:hypothetical protein